MRALVADRLDPAAVARLREAGLEVVERTGLKGQELVAALAGVDALLVRGATRVTAEVLAGAPSLRVVVRAGTGLDNIDVAAARERGVFVSNTPAANAVSVAELVFAMLLAFERHVVPAAADLRAGRWEKTRWQGRELAGRTLGLVGFGRIGREVAVRARAFAMPVRWNDPWVVAPPELAWATPATLEELLAASDVVSLHLPLTPETRNLIDARALARMKPDALLVNAARGGIVNEAALHAALTSGALRGALLDGFAEEPAPAGHPLIALPNVLALPHLGASTEEAQGRAGLEAAEIVIEQLRAARPQPR